MPSALLQLTQGVTGICQCLTLPGASALGERFSAGSQISGEDTAWHFGITQWDGLGCQIHWEMRDPAPFVLKSAWFMSPSCSAALQ